MIGKWKCKCGFIHDGSQAPGSCPKCGASAEAFTQLSDSEANLVENSRRTNMLLCKLIELGREIEGVCKAGIEDELDPNCVDVFEKSLAHSYETMKLAMTEMQSHMSKGKWG